MSEPTAAELAVTAARTADDKKAERTLVLFVGDVLSITDYFVITSALEPPPGAHRGGGDRGDRARSSTAVPRFVSRGSPSSSGC